MNLRVVKQEGDEEKNSYKVTMKGNSNLVADSMIEVELRLKGKTEDLLEKFPRGYVFKFDLAEEPHSQ